MASIICVRSFPARPTNGRPCASSSAPGPSPTKMRSALEEPSPKTILLRVLCSLQRVHSPRSARTIGRVSPAILFAASNSDGPAAAGKTADCDTKAFGADGLFAEDLGKGDSSMDSDGDARV